MKIIHLEQKPHDFENISRKIDIKDCAFNHATGKELLSKNKNIWNK